MTAWYHTNIGGGTVMANRSNGQSRDYEKSSACRNREWWYTSGYCTLRRKPIARYRAVGLSLRAGRFGGRATCDTTTMNDTSRPDTANGCIKMPRNVHCVHSAKNRVDTNNRHTAGRFLNYVHSSNGISRMAIVENKLTHPTALLESLRKCNRIGRVDTDGISPPPSCDNLCPLEFRPSGHCGHNSGEVTL